MDNEDKLLAIEFVLNLLNICFEDIMDVKIALFFEKVKELANEAIVNNNTHLIIIY